MINSLSTQLHEDERRLLIEWVKDFPVKNCKALIVKEKVPLGDHYHKNKEEIFYLLCGAGEVILDGISTPLVFNDIVHVKRGVRHTFLLESGSILLEAGTEPFDPTDDYK